MQSQEHLNRDSDMSYSVKVEKLNDTNYKPMADEDDPFEDDFFDVDTNQINDRVWLVKVPKFIKERWEAVEEEDKTLGWVQLKQYENEQTLRLVLPNEEEYEGIPLQHNIVVTNKQPLNTFALQETSTELQKELSRQSSSTQDANSGYSGRKWATMFHSKNTRKALVGTVAHECSVTPINDEKYRSVLATRTKKAAQPKRKIVLLDEKTGNIQAASGLPIRSFSNFIKNNKSRYANIDILKNQRLPRDQLLDLLFRCFEQYDYWPLKKLREQLKQPETYLRETLESIAILQRKGAYDSMWYLKPEYKSRIDMMREQSESETSSSYPNEAKESENLDAMQEDEEDEDEDDNEDKDLSNKMDLA